jgi:aspartyl/asparaginyl-tRNA synthetase
MSSLYHVYKDCVLFVGNTVFNEFVNVHNEPKTILLRAWMQRKQQQSRFEILQISKQSCTVSVIICVNNM